MSNFKLGTKLRDKISGFEGVAIARTEWLYSCVRWTLSPSGLKDDGGTKANHTFDEPQLEHVEEVIELLPRPNGGPGPNPQRTKDPTQ